MTNKTERYFACSESELSELSLAAFNYWDMLNNGRVDNSEEDDFDRFDAAKAACRARPVRFIGAADQGNSLMLWGEMKK